MIRSIGKVLVLALAPQCASGAPAAPGKGNLQMWVDSAITCTRK